MELANQEHQFIAEIKERVRKAQSEALKVVNTELITLYWDIGRAIVDKQKLGWGKSIVPKLSKELQKEFPGVGGFSTTNLWYMAQFYTEYQSDTNLQPMVG